jgi:hypothetical protein
LLECLSTDLFELEEAEAKDRMKEVQESFEEISRQLVRQRARRDESGEVNTLYKKVGDKVRHVDTPRKDTPMELGREDWRERAIARQAEKASLRGPDLGPFDHIFDKRTADFPSGTRLTPARLEKMNVGEDLLPNELRLLQ